MKRLRQEYHFISNSDFLLFGSFNKRSRSTLGLDRGMYTYIELLLIKRNDGKKGNLKECCSFNKIFFFSNELWFQSSTDLSLIIATLQSIKYHNYVGRRLSLVLSQILLSIPCPGCQWLTKNSNHINKRGIELLGPILP